MQYIVVDIGATYSKAAIMDINGNLVEESCIPLKTGDDVLMLVVSQLENLKNGNSITAAAAACTGIVDGENVLFSPRLGFKDVPLKRLLEEKLNIPIRLFNGADAAALGEHYFGAGKGYDDMLMLTLDTGVGGSYIKGGLVLNKQGGEFGHIIIDAFGRNCECGGKGCLESYVSATALINDTKMAAAKHSDSLINSYEKIDGVTAFLAEKRGDKYAKEVIENYINYLAAGLFSLNNIFRPQLIVLGGGILTEGENLLSRLRASLAEYNYGFKNLSAPVITAARLGEKAGLFGAYASLTRM